MSDSTKNIYDSRPPRDALLARLKRDKIDPATVVEIVLPVRHYAIRAYGVPTTDSSYERGPDGTVESRIVPAFYVFKTRRDGKVSNSWGLPYKASQMISIAPADLANEGV